MIGYGMAKAAVHQLTKSLAAKGSGLPKDSLVAAVLPVTLDTPMNRKWMADADTSTWTPLEFVAKYKQLLLFVLYYYCLFTKLYIFCNSLFWKWSQNEDRPASGSLLQLITKDNKTELITA